MNHTQLLSQLIDIIRFRSGPQDLPASGNILIMAVLASGIISLVGFSGMGITGSAMAQIIIATLFGLLFLRVALQFRGGANRFTQAATAMFGTDALLTMVALPATMGLDPGAETASSLAVFWLLLVLLWTVAVISHIFRHALDLPLPGGILVAVLYLFLSLNVTSALVA